MPGEYRIKLLKGAQKDRDNIRQYPRSEGECGRASDRPEARPVSKPSALRKAPGQYGGHVFPAHQSPAQARIRSGYGQQDRPHHFHVDALRINTPARKYGRVERILKAARTLAPPQSADKAHKRKNCSDKKKSEAIFASVRWICRALRDRQIQSQGVALRQILPQAKFPRQRPCRLRSLTSM